MAARVDHARAGLPGRRLPALIAEGVVLSRECVLGQGELLAYSARLCHTCSGQTRFEPLPTNSRCHEAETQCPRVEGLAGK